MFYNAAMNTTLRSKLALLIVVTVAVVATTASALPPQDQTATSKPAVSAAKNFTQVDATLACSGALAPEAYAQLKNAGFASIVNLREASEEGANVEAEAKAAADAGLTYIHLPFASKTPDATKVDAFLKAVVAAENQPMLVHCASGGRASMFWAIKRVMVDGWPVEKAMNELPDLTKNVGQPLRAFALDYLKSHGK